MELPELYLCPKCRDRYSLVAGRPCHVCLQQEIIDDDIPTPFDWSVWDDEGKDEDSADANQPD